jgi:hypothetical protein
VVLKKGLIKVLVFAIFAILLCGCERKLHNEIELDAGLKEFNGEDLEEYADMRFNWDYDILFDFEDTRQGSYPIRHSVYIWGKEFRNELRDTIILLGYELDELKKDRIYSFYIDDSKDFNIIVDGKEIIRLEKSRSTAVLSLLLTPYFNANVSTMYTGLSIMSIALETSKETSDFEIVEISVNVEKYYTHSYHSGHNDKQLYGFTTVADIESFLDGTYLEKTEKINTGGNQEIKLDDPQVCNISMGQYYWFNFTAFVPGEYVFFTNGGVDTKLVLANSIEGTTEIEDDNSGIDGNASISYELSKDEKVYIKVMGANVDDWGLSVIKVIKPYIYI